MKWNLFVQKYFGLFFLVGLLGGFFFPDYFLGINNFVLLILGTVMTLAFLTLDLAILVQNLKKIHIHILIFLILKILIPTVLFHLVFPINKTLALAFLLITLTPVAVVAPALTKLVRGDFTFILVQLILSSLLSPLYMPVMLNLVAGSAIAMNTREIMVMLIKVMFIPFGISLIFKKFGPSIIAETKSKYSAYSVILISILLLGLVAKGAPAIKNNLASSLPLALETYLLGIILMLAGYFLFFPLDKAKRVSLAMGSMYMNIGLTIVLASQFFTAEVMIICILYELPANTLPVLIQKLHKPVSVV